MPENLPAVTLVPEVSLQKITLTRLNGSSVKWNPARKFIRKQWKVVGPMGNVSKYPNTAKYSLIDNDCIVGDSWVVFGNFKTKTEAANYLEYLRSPVIKDLLKSSSGGKLTRWGTFVPDLEDYTSKNPLFQSNKTLGKAHEYYGLDLEDRLHLLFGLSDTEKQLISVYKKV